MQGMTGDEAYGALSGIVSSLASGFDHAEQIDDTHFKVYFQSGSPLTFTIPKPEIDYTRLEADMDGFIAEWLEEHKEDIKGEDGADGKTVYVGATEDAPEEAVLIFDKNELLGDEDFYNKTQSDVRFAKAKEVGDITTLVVDTWEDLVDAINTTFLAGAGDFNFDASRRILEIITRGGRIINIDVSQIILATNITDFADMLVLNIKEGESLVWNDTKKKFVNKAIDSSAVYEQAKAYTDLKVEQMTDTDAIPCDAEPTYFGGIVTYVQSGVSKQIEVTGKKVFFYYYNDEEQTSASQVIWINGTRFKISMGGNLNLTDYVKKEVVTDTFDSEFTDREKIPNTQYIKDMVDYLGEELGGDASAITYEFDTHPEWKTVKNALDGIINKIEYVKPSITSFTANPSTTVYEKGQKVAKLVFNWVLNKAVATQTLTGCTISATDRTATYDTEISSKKTFTLSVSDGENSASSNFTVDFQNKIYSGSASEGTYNSAFILALANKKFATSKAGTYSMTVGSGQYGYIAYPKSMGQITSAKIGGFDTDLVNCGDVQFTNASGYTETYNIVRTGRDGLGSLSMVVS